MQKLENTWQELRFCRHGRAVTHSIHSMHKVNQIIISLLSGTHWLMEIVYLMLANGEMDKINRSMMEQGLEFTMCAGPSEVPKTKPGYEHMNEWPSPRVMVSHLCEKFLPPQLWEKKAKVSGIIIYIFFPSS